MIHEVFVQLNDLVKVGQLLFIAEGVEIIVEVETQIDRRVSKFNITAREEVEIGRVLMEIETVGEKYMLSSRTYPAGFSIRLRKRSFNISYGEPFSGITDHWLCQCTPIQLSSTSEINFDT